MSYAAQPPVAAPPPGARPAAVTTAVALLWTMAVAGLAYAIGMVSIAPSTVGRFRDATGGTDQVESFIAVVWIDAAVALVLAVLIGALFAVLGVGLRRGSRLARGVTLGACAFGFLAGIGSLLAIAGQRAGEALPGSVGAALGAAYPDGWITLNVAVAAAQVLGYLVVAALLLLAPRSFFGGAAPADPAGFSAPGHPAYAAAPISAPAAHWPAYPPPAGSPPGYGAPAGYSTQAGYGAPARYSAPAGSPPGYSAPAGSPPGYGSPAGPPLGYGASSPAYGSGAAPAYPGPGAYPASNPYGSPAGWGNPTHAPPVPPGVASTTVPTPGGGHHTQSAPSWPGTHSPAAPASEEPASSSEQTGVTPSEPDQTSPSRTVPNPPPGSEDEYWSRPPD